MHLEQVDPAEAPPQGDPPQGHGGQMRATLSAYVDAVQDLLRGKYAAVKQMLPPYLADPGNFVAFGCDDGIIVRIDPNTGDRKTLVVRLKGGIKEHIFQISEGVIHCSASAESAPEKLGVTLKLQVATATGEVKTEVAEMGISCHMALTPPNPLPTPPAKPCAMSIVNRWEFEVHGEELSPDRRPHRRFIARTPVRFGCLGWDRIEVYPHTAPENWKPEYAPLWAETDILAAVVAHQTRESHFQGLDPNAGARAHKVKVLNEYRELLDTNPEREETLQQYLTMHPELLCPTYIRCIPKVPLGAKVTDFVFQNATGEYMLVELERSTLRLFLTGKRECDPSAELNHARSQIGDWKRYLEDNLSTVQKELGLPGISSNPRSLIVIGRSAALNESQNRKLAAMANESPTTTILTYDDVLSAARAAIENILGPLGETSGQTQMYYPPGA